MTYTKMPVPQSRVSSKFTSYFRS